MNTAIENPSNVFEVNGKDFSYDYENPINEGKTKRVLKVFNYNGNENDEYVVIEEKNIASAGDGARMEKVEGNDGLGKGDYSATINKNYSKFLKINGVNTAFVKSLDNNHYLVKKLDMIPAECVFRFVETGSYTKRQESLLGDNANPDGTVLPEMVVELFYKDDVFDEKGEKISDPLILLDENQIPKLDDDGFLRLAYPKTGEEISYKKDDKEEMKKKMNIICENHSILTQQTAIIGKLIKRFGEIVNLSTFDGKIEFGFDKDGNIIHGDSIDADSNRIRKLFTVLGKDGTTYLAKDYNTEELKTSGKDSSFFKELDEIPNNVEVKKILLAIGLDKDGFRAGESSDDYLTKVKNLAELSTEAFEIFIAEVTKKIEITKNELLEILETNLSSKEVFNVVKDYKKGFTDIIGRKIT